VTSVTRRAAAVVGALVLTAAAAACSSGSGGGTGARAGGRGGAGDEAVSEPTGPPYSVGHRALRLVDDSRPTPAAPAQHRARRPDRTIDVDLYYPAAGDPGPEPDGEQPGAPATATDGADPAPGRPFPLVVFAHGFNGQGRYFEGFAQRWARQGYAVALPTFPLSRTGIADADDVVNQPGDISFVVDEIAGLDRGDPLAGAIDTDKLVVGGHSLGSATVFGVAYNSCCVDPRIDGVISVSGGPLPYPGGDYDGHPTTPLLLVHGGKDATVPVGAGNYIFDQRWASPMWYLRPAAADHSGVFLGEPGRLFEQAAIAFLAAELRDDPAALDGMGAVAERSGAADWQVSRSPGRPA
jgi:dienelactone hydrolase